MGNIEKVKWTPATKENEFVNEMWDLFSDFGGAIKDEYTVSFEAMDCFFRNVHRWLNRADEKICPSTGNPCAFVCVMTPCYLLSCEQELERSVATEADSSNEDGNKKNSGNQTKT